MQDRPPGMLRSSATFFIASIVIFLARFLTSIIIARSPGPDGKGIYFLVLSTATIFTLVISFGLNSAVTYFTASKKFTIMHLFGFILLAVVILGTIGVVIFFTAYQVILSTTVLKDVNPIFIYIILALLPFNLFSSLLMSILLGEQRILTYNLIEISRALLILVLQLLSFLLGAGINGAIFAWVTANLLVFIVTLYLLRDQFHIPDQSSMTVVRPAFLYGIKSYLANLLTFCQLLPRFIFCKLLYQPVGCRFV